MKNKSIGILLVLIGILATALASAEEGGATTGNGGGGVRKNGIYMTFYSAGLYVEPSGGAPDAAPQIPALNRLIQYVEKLAYVSDMTKQTVLRAILPTTTRRYFWADPKLLSPEIRARLIAEFTRVTHLDAVNLTLYALTDTVTQTTFLLPEFSQLDADDQASILFHENYWVLNPRATYDTVVAAEMAFEAALKEPRSLARAFDLSRYIGEDREVIQAFVQWEISSGNLRGFVDARNRIRIYQLFGPDALACFGRNRDADPSWAYERCYSYFRQHLDRLIESYPKSMILRSLARHLNNDQWKVLHRLLPGFTANDPQGRRQVTVPKFLACLIDVSPDPEKFEKITCDPKLSWEPFGTHADFGLDFKIQK